MKLPNGERAVVDVAKLTQYCLNPQHVDGKHKARVFAAALGLKQLDFVLKTPSGSAVIRSGWIVRYGEDYPRLTTCYVKGAL